MIARSWRAIAPSEQAVDEYAEHLQRSTFKEMAMLPGHLGATLSKKIIEGRHEVLVVSYWKDLDSALPFTKGEIDDAVVKLSTQQKMLSYDAKVEYFETLVDTVAR